MGDFIGICGVIAVIGLLIFARSAGGHSRGTQEMQVKAIEAGVAEYQVDAKTGEVSFVWKVQHANTEH